MLKKEKVVWITGASSGIGKAIALEFAKNRKNVAVSSRNEKKLSALKKEAGDKIKVYPVDISELNSIEKTYKKISEEFEIDCIVNNAGVTSFTTAEKTPLNVTKNIIDTNLTAAIFLIKSVLPKMIEKKSGTIINILSVAANTVFTKSSVYAASKAGLAAFSKSLREELRNDNIKVVNVYPGATRTPIWGKSSLEKFGDKMMNPDDIAKMIYEIYKSESNMVPEELVLRPVTGDL